MLQTQNFSLYLRASLNYQKERSLKNIFFYIRKCRINTLANHFLTHSLIRRLTKCTCIWRKRGRSFQLTASQGGWRYTWSRSHHQELHFNSQPHKEADRNYFPDGSGNGYFNSQPHKEADSNFKQKSFYLKLFFIFITQILFNFPSHHHILQCPTYKTRPFSGANVLGFSAHRPFALQY